jgi:hypothetical protein
MRSRGCRAAARARSDTVFSRFIYRAASHYPWPPIAARAPAPKVTAQQRSIGFAGRPRPIHEHPVFASKSSSKIEGHPRLGHFPRLLPDMPDAPVCGGPVASLQSGRFLPTSDRERRCGRRRLETSGPRPSRTGAAHGEAA